MSGKSDAIVDIAVCLLTGVDLKHTFYILPLTQSEANTKIFILLGLTLLMLRDLGLSVAKSSDSECRASLMHLTGEARGSAGRCATGSLDLGTMFGIKQVQFRLQESSTLQF